MRRSLKAFSLLELLVVIAVVAVLLSVLLPALIAARASSYRALCASNLRQISAGWQGYLAENRETFPRFDAIEGIGPEWAYGGAEFVGPQRTPVLASERPINRHVAGEGRVAGEREIALFRCPADAGVFARGEGSRGAPGISVLGERTCFLTFGTSYRANPNLMDSTSAGIDTHRRALRLHEVQVDHSRLLLAGDPAWWFASRPEGDSDSGLEASWHRRQDGGNVLSVDGSVRFVDFSKWPEAPVELMPRR